jgi:hypothetical protein
MNTRTSDPRFIGAHDCETAKAQSDHDHPVSEAGSTPFPHEPH